MREVDPGAGPCHDRGEPPAPPLSALALRYAGGELDGDEAADFEKRLGEEQAACEALTQAVHLARSLAGHKPPTPDPAYRAEVHRRLRPPGFWGRLLAPRSYPGHPALWTGVGAAAAVLLTAVVLHAPASRGREPAPDPVAVGLPEPAAVPRPADGASTPEVARVWAALNNSEHLARAQEEVRRRGRAEDRPARLHALHVQHR
jgi:hypothetical protein